MLPIIKQLIMVQYTLVITLGYDQWRTQNENRGVLVGQHYHKVS